MYLEWKWLKPVVDAVLLTDKLLSALLVADSWYTVDTAPLVLAALPVKLRAVAGWPVKPGIAAGWPIKLGLAADWFADSLKALIGTLPEACFSLVLGRSSTAGLGGESATSCSLAANVRTGDCILSVAASCACRLGPGVPAPLPGVAAVMLRKAASKVGCPGEMPPRRWLFTTFCPAGVCGSCSLSQPKSVNARLTLACMSELTGRAAAVPYSSTFRRSLSH